MKDWLLGMIGTALFSSLALAFCPKGGPRQVTAFVCALLCALALAGPLLELDMESLGIGLAEYREQAAQIAAEEEEEAKRMQRTYIEQECAAYILSEAEALGLSPTELRVSAQWDSGEGLWYPWEAELGLAYHGELSRRIEGELGIPKERQRWTE